MDSKKTQHGTKRKRNESESLDDFSKVLGKLHHGLKDIHRAAKKAKVFETQKLVKRLKAIRENALKDPDITEHTEQLIILKATKHEAVANTAIKSKIIKDRVLSQHKRIQEALAREISGNLLSTTSQSPSAAKVHSRLLSSKILATEISSLCDDLRKLLGHEPEKTRVEVVKGDGPKARGTPKSSLFQETTSSDSLSGEESHGTDKNSDEIPQVSGVAGDGEQSDTDSWESGSISIDEVDQEGKDTIAGKAPSKPMFKQSSTTSAFLPSLSVGFVRGSDGSDWSDSEAKIVDSDKKKNRRGQRARRAIWEKKYGKNANHKKRELKESNRMLSKDNRKNVHGSRLEQRDRHPPQLGGNHGPYGPNTTTKDDEPLHPSWEAKRRLKEKQIAGIVPSQGTKIKFSD